MNFITQPLYKHAKLLMLLCFGLAILLVSILFRIETFGGNFQNAKLQMQKNTSEFVSMTNETFSEQNKTRRKEYLYRLLTNTTRSLIQMEIKARRLEENMRRIKEKTADLLWKNEDKALWHILFKNISRHVSIRHQFHQHSSLNRIMQDSYVRTHRPPTRKRRLF